MRFTNGKLYPQWSDLNPINIGKQMAAAVRLSTAVIVASASHEEIDQTCNKGGQLYPIEGESFTVWANRSVRFWKTPR